MHFRKPWPLCPYYLVPPTTYSDHRCRRSHRHSIPPFGSHEHDSSLSSIPLVSILPRIPFSRFLFFTPLSLGFFMFFFLRYCYAFVFSVFCFLFSLPWLFYSSFFMLLDGCGEKKWGIFLFSLLLIFNCFSNSFVPWVVLWGKGRDDHMRCIVALDRLIVLPPFAFPILLCMRLSLLTFFFL